MRRIALAIALIVAVGLTSSCGGGGKGSSGSPPDVLVIHAILPAYVADVTSKLSAFGVFGAVDAFDAGSATPLPADLSPYEAVLVLSDDNFTDSVALGNALADYMDAGGGVVLAMFTLSSAGADTLNGRFLTDNYYAMTTSSGNGIVSNGGISVLVPTHPVLQGVSSFNGGAASFMPQGSSLVSGATMVATWDDAASTPLIAVRSVNGHRRVDLGFYPVTQDSGRSDFVDPATDAMLIVANSLRWVSGDL